MLAISEIFPNSRKLARVLVVDNDPLTAELLRAVAQQEGYQVVTATDGRDAFRMLKSNADYAAAVFNMTMPNLNGVDLVRHMKTERRLIRIPVVIVAGGQGVKLITESFAAGALAFLPKPLTSSKLAQIVRLVSGRHTAGKQVCQSGKLAA